MRPSMPPTSRAAAAGWRWLLRLCLRLRLLFARGLGVLLVRRLLGDILLDRLELAVGVAASDRWDDRPSVLMVGGSTGIDGAAGSAAGVSGMVMVSLHARTSALRSASYDSGSAGPLPGCWSAMDVLALSGSQFSDRPLHVVDDLEHGWLMPRLAARRCRIGPDLDAADARVCSRKRALLSIIAPVPGCLSTGIASEITPRGRPECLAGALALFTKRPARMTSLACQIGSRPKPALIQLLMYAALKFSGHSPPSRAQIS